VLRRIASAGAGLLLSGCLTLAVGGNVDGTGESFTGSATGYLDRSGLLTVTASSGVTCSGRFVYVTRRYGQGDMTCSDGRAGSFDFVSNGLSGFGRGSIGGQPIHFTFGIV